MNERQHIALTEAQIIAAEKGELQLETRDGRKVVQLAWYRLPYDQNCSDIITAVVVDIEGFAMTHSYYKTGIFKTNRLDCLDLFVSEQAVDFSEPAEQSPKPLYEVGEIIEVIEDDEKCDAEYITTSRGKVIVWESGCVESYGEGNHRKKQTEKTVTIEGKVMTVKDQVSNEFMKTIYISGRITGLPYDEAFTRFKKAEEHLQCLGYLVVNPMVLVPYNKDWSWFDYMGEDIKLLGKCDSIYMLKDWHKSDGAWIEHEISIMKNLTIIYEQ